MHFVTSYNIFHSSTHFDLNPTQAGEEERRLQFFKLCYFTIFLFLYSLLVLFIFVLHIIILLLTQEHITSFLYSIICILIIAERISARQLIRVHISANTYVREVTLRNFISHAQTSRSHS